MPYLNYLLTFPNGKFYVGYTKTSVKRRLTEHRSTVRNGKRSKLYNAWRKYGIDSPIIDVVETFDTKHEALHNEIRLIALWNTTNQDFGYNSTRGGEGCNTGGNHDWRVGKNTEEIQKITNKIKRFGSANHFYGCHHSEDTKVCAVRHRIDSGSYDTSWNKGILITPNRYEFRGRYFANQRQIQSMFKLAAKTVVKLVRSGEIKDASRG